MLVRSLITAAVVAFLVFIGEAQAQTLRFGHANTTAEIAGELFQEFADRVTKATGGAVTIRVFPAEQLGKEVDLVKQVKEGALDMSAPSMAAASALVPALEMASAPFIWRDWNEAEAIIRSVAFDPVFDELRERHSIVPVSRVWYWGWRNVTTLRSRGQKARRPARPQDPGAGKPGLGRDDQGLQCLPDAGAIWRSVYGAPTADGRRSGEPHSDNLLAQVLRGAGRARDDPSHASEQHDCHQPRQPASLKPEHREILFAEAARASAMNTYLQQKREASMLEDIRKSGRTKIIEDVDRDAFAERARACHAGDGGALGQGQPRPPHGCDRHRPQALTRAMPLAMHFRRLDDCAEPARTFSSPASTHSIATLVVAAVVFRYMLSDPLTWSEELILLLFGWMIFLGIANAFRARTHIIIDFVVLFAPRRGRPSPSAIVAFAATARAPVRAHVVSRGATCSRDAERQRRCLASRPPGRSLPLVVGCALSLLHLLRNLMDDGPPAPSGPTSRRGSETRHADDPPRDLRRDLLVGRHADLGRHGGLRHAGDRESRASRSPSPRSVSSRECSRSRSWQSPSSRWPDR